MSAKQSGFLQAGASKSGFGQWIMQPGPGTRFLGSGRWIAYNDDPQILLYPPDGRLRSGVYEMCIVSSPASELPLTPRIYFNLGQGYNEADAVQLPTITDSETRLVVIPAGTAALRFDPIAQRGNFIVQEILFRRVGPVEFVGHIGRQTSDRRRLLSALVKQGPAEAVRMLDSRHQAPGSGSYAAWLQRAETVSADNVAKIRAHIAAMPRKPMISVIMPAYNSNPDWLKQAIDSIRRQYYDAWELCIVDDASPDKATWEAINAIARVDARIKARRLEANGGIAAATNAGLAEASGEWIAFMDHDDLIRPDALALVADAIVRNDGARIIYTDEDKIDEKGVRSEPYMKGGWNRELFYSQNLLNHLTVVRRDLIDAAGPLRSAFDGSQDYDLMLRCIEKTDDASILHLPFVCYHWRFASHRVNFSQAHAGKALDNGIRALQGHFDRTGATATAARASENSIYMRAKWRLEPKPLVSLIIPTRDRKSILETAIRSIRERTTYSNYEILIVDNDSREPETRAYFDSLSKAGVARIVPAPGPFNFSRINNIAAAAAEGAILGFVNNDVEVRNGEWLDEMVSHFARPDVGAVGAKLYYADGRIQHAGVVTGVGGVAGHLYKLFPEDAPGPFSLLDLPRETSAATAACLLVRAGLFREVGGFDEINLLVAFNDVDLCLKIRRAGAKIIWTPFARLTHHESVSRGVDTDPDKQERFQREVRHMLATWGQDALDADPYYSPNLTLTEENGALALPVRARRPWE